MTKKVYTQPKLKTQVVELGVFGSYNSANPSGKREPSNPVNDLNLHME